MITRIELEKQKQEKRRKDIYECMSRLKNSNDDTHDYLNDFGWAKDMITIC
jgi:hypothetical protein